MEMQAFFSKKLRNFSLFSCRDINLKYILFIRVYHLCLIVGGQTGKGSSVIHMHMSVDKKGRLVLIHQSAEYLKPSVGQILPVIKLIGRRVSQQYVKSSAIFEPPPEFPYPPAHLRLGVLMAAGLVAHGAPQAQNADPLMHIDLILDAGTAVGRNLLISLVMVSMHIQNRPMSKRGQKRQILRF